MTVKAMDVSNYTGEADFGPAYEAGFRHVIVRLSTETPFKTAVAVQQLRAARDAGMTTSGYVWVNWADDPYPSADFAMGVAVEAGVELRYVWLDMEGGPPQLGSTWLADYYAGLGTDQRVGIYTSAGWWRQYGHLGLPYRTGRRGPLPLWLAHYDDCPRLSSPLMPLPPWRRLAGKQYQGSAVRHGVLCDVSVFNKRYV